MRFQHVTLCEKPSVAKDVAGVLGSNGLSGSDWYEIPFGALGSSATWPTA